MITLDNGMLLSLAARADVRAAFPELSALATKRRRSSSCCGGRSELDEALQRARAAMAGLSDARKQKLKELLGTSGPVEVRWSGVGGGAVRHTTF